MDLQIVLKVLQRKAWILFSIPLLAVVCAVFLISGMDKDYKSEAQLATGFTATDDVRIEDVNSSSWEINTKFINLNESMNSLTVMSLVSYRLIIHDLESKQPFRILKEEDRLEKNITEKVLQDSKEAFKQYLGQLKPLNSASIGDRELFTLLNLYEYNYEDLRDNFKIKRVSTSDFITVEFTSENPYLSAYAVNTLCEEFLRYNKTLKTDRSSESIQFFENVLDDKKRILDLKTTALKDFKVDNNIFNYGAESENKILQITDYELSKEKESKNIKGLLLSINNVEAKIKNYSQVNDQEAVLVNQRIIHLKDQINQINYSGNDQDKIKLKRLRDELQLEISRLGLITDSNPIDGLKDLEKERDRLKLELEISRSNLASIESSLRRFKYDVSGFATKEARIADLEREVKVASEEYLDAQEKYNSAKNRSLSVGSSLRQILIGQPNLDPEPSKAIVIIGLTGFSSFALCLFVLLLTEYSDMKIRIPAQLERLTGLKNVGIVNHIKINEFDIEKTFNEKSGNKESNALVHLLRKLRYEVQKSQGHVILISSTQANVGKSFIIICLSYTLSLIKKRILIIDTNFKKNSLTKLLLAHAEERKLLNSGQIKKTILLEKIKNGTSANGYYNIISKTKFSGVDLIGNVGGTGSPSEILAGRDFKEMLSSLTDQYDFIFLEGPSLNNYADSKELVEFVDRVIAVFGADTNLKDSDKESLSFLKSLKGKLVGSILNKVQLKDLSV